MYRKDSKWKNLFFGVPPLLIHWGELGDEVQPPLLVGRGTHSHPLVPGHYLPEGDRAEVDPLPIGHPVVLETAVEALSGAVPARHEVHVFPHQPFHVRPAVQGVGTWNFERSGVIEAVPRQFFQSHEALCVLGILLEEVVQ